MVIKKRSFVLLEALIALSLLAIFTPWLMRLPIEHYQRQIKAFEKIEEERIADWSYSEVKEMLLKQDISQDKLPLKGQKAFEWSLPDAQMHLPFLPPRLVHRMCKLECKREKEGSNGDIYRLYALTISLKHSKYRYLYRFRLKDHEIIY